jgi:hypothetical protein
MSKIERECAGLRAWAVYGWSPDVAKSYGWKIRPEKFEPTDEARALLKILSGR